MGPPAAAAAAAAAPPLPAAAAGVPPAPAAHSAGAAEATSTEAVGAALPPSSPRSAAGSGDVPPADEAGPTTGTTFAALGQAAAPGQSLAGKAGGGSAGGTTKAAARAVAAPAAPTSSSPAPTTPVLAPAPAPVLLLRRAVPKPPTVANPPPGTLPFNYKASALHAAVEGGDVAGLQRLIQVRPSLSLSSCAHARTHAAVMLALAASRMPHPPRHTRAAPLRPPPRAPRSCTGHKQAARAQQQQQQGSEPPDLEALNAAGETALVVAVNLGALVAIELLSAAGQAGRGTRCTAQPTPKCMHVRRRR